MKVKNDQSDISVLLLHGAAFSSKIWETLGTFDKLTQWGIPSVAIDMPSYKESKSVQIPRNKAGCSEFCHGFECVDFLMKILIFDTFFCVF